MPTIAETYADMKVRTALTAMLPAISQIDLGCYICVTEFCETVSEALRPLGWQIFFDGDRHASGEGDILECLRVLPVKDNEKV